MIFTLALLLTIADSADGTSNWGCLYERLMLNFARTPAMCGKRIYWTLNLNQFIKNSQTLVHFSATQSTANGSPRFKNGKHLFLKTRGFLNGGFWIIYFIDFANIKVS